jgi:hypothetical protein
MSSHMVRGERLPFDCSVMKVRFKTPEYQGLLYAATLFELDNRPPPAFLDSCRGPCGLRSRARSAYVNVS